MSYQTNNNNNNIQQVNRQGARQASNAPSPRYGHFPNNQNPYHHYTPTTFAAPQNWHTNPYGAQLHATQAAPAHNIHSSGLHGIPYYQNSSTNFSTVMIAHNIQQFQNAQNYQQLYNVDNIQESQNTQNISYTQVPRTTQAAPVASQAQHTGEQNIDQMLDQILQNAYDPAYTAYTGEINFDEIDWDNIPAGSGYFNAESLRDPITQAPYGQPTPQSFISDSPQCLETYHGSAECDEHASYASSRPSQHLDEHGFPPTPQNVNDVQYLQPAPPRSSDIYQPTSISSRSTGIPSVIEACVTPAQTASQVSTDRQISQDPEVQIVSERELPVQQEPISLLEDEEGSSKSATPPQRSPSRPIQRFKFSEEDLALEQAFKDVKTRNKFIRAEIHATSRSKTGGDARNVRWWQVRAGKATQKPYFKTDPETYHHAQDRQSYKCRHQGPSDSQIKNCNKEKCQHQCCKSGKDHPDYEFVYGPTGSETRARFQGAKEGTRAVATLVGMGTNEEESADNDLEADMLAALGEESDNDDLEADMTAALEEDGSADQEEPVNVEKATDITADVSAPVPGKENSSIEAQGKDDYDPLFDDDDDSEDDGGVSIEFEIVDPEANKSAGQSADPQDTREDKSSNGLPANFEPKPIVGEKRARGESSEDDQQPPILSPLPVPAARHHNSISNSQTHPQQQTSAKPQPSTTAKNGPKKGKKRALSEADDAGSSSAAPPAAPPTKKQKTETPAPGSNNDFGIDKNIEVYRDPAFPKGYICGHRAFSKLENCLNGTCGGQTGQKSHLCCIQELNRAAAKKMILNKLRSCRRKAEKNNGGKGTKTQVTASLKTPIEPSTSSAQELNAPSTPGLENVCYAPVGATTTGQEHTAGLQVMDEQDLELYEALRNRLENDDSAEQASAEQYTVPDAVYNYESSSESEEE